MTVDRHASRKEAPRRVGASLGSTWFLWSPARVGNLTVPEGSKLRWQGQKMFQILIFEGLGQQGLKEKLKRIRLSLGFLTAKCKNS